MSEHAIRNAAAWWRGIREMVANLNPVGWHQCSLCDTPDKCRDDAMCALREVGEDEELARERIMESPLAVQIRCGWWSPGDPGNAAEPEEYAILLSTGGPALRIYGRLDRYGKPDDFPTLQWQNWDTPWTNWRPEDMADYRATLQTFASQFYFGG